MNVGNVSGDVAQRLLLLKRLAMWCAVCVLTIISISAFIRLSNAGLGCADWPQCYGQNLRQAQQGVTEKPSEGNVIIAVRMVHRVVAVAALVMIIVMIATCFGINPVPRQECVMAVALLLLALFLAVLGRWSSSARIPAVVIGNLLGGFAMLALCWRLRGQVIERLGGFFDAAGKNSSGNVFLRVGAWGGVVTLLCQIALGGLMSGSYAGLSCIGMLECAAPLGPAIGVFDPTGASILAALDPWREPVFAFASPVNPAGVLPHMAHRYGAIATILVLFPLALFALYCGKRRIGWAMLSLLVLQAGLGMALIAFSLPLPVALAHNLTAAMMLVVVFCLV